jgi:CheY-like chemotaxis protein
VNRLQQIIKNLLSNAFKFTKEGEIAMEIRLADPQRKFGVEMLDQSKRVFAFTVKDTGIGIPKEKQKLIFEAFQQADGTTSRKYGGTGLGLTISREIARLLGGMIEVESAPGTGSTFTLYLPEAYSGAEAVIRDGAPDEPSATPKLPENADFSGKKVVIIDDDMRNIFAITTILESQNMKVLYAANGKDGVKLLKDHPDTDLVLMDVMMPEMDGIEATQIIRKTPEFVKLPIISLTAKAMKGDRDKCLAAGASDYITKPVDPEKLLSMMHFWMHKESSLSTN